MVTMLLSGVVVFGSYKWLESRYRIEKLEQRTEWMCRLPVAGPDNAGQLVIIPGYDGQYKLEGCP
jgi:hypothetical protein